MKLKRPPENISQEIILNLNRVDNAIYHHFLEKFDANVERFGYQNMQHEIQDLKNGEDQFSKYCDSVFENYYHSIFTMEKFSAMSKQEIYCQIAFDKFEHYYLTDLMKKQQSTQNKKRIKT